MSITRCIALFGLLVAVAACSSSKSVTESPDASPSDPVVAVYADTALTLSAFERAYRTAQPDSQATDSLAAHQRFLDQYVNYRLKVQAARDAGLDSLPSVQRDIRSYRKELARPRLMKTEIYEPLIKTLYERRKTKVDVSHILLRVKPEAPPEDTLAAYRRLQSIADSARRGISFGDLAYRHSEDPSAQKKGQSGYRGHLGYLRAGRIVEPFEKRMYTVSPDSISEVFRTRFGYHVLKVHNRKPTEPPFRLSHIMVRADSTGDQARQLLDSLRTELVRDTADFARLARQYSVDRRSAPKGGDLGRINAPESLPPAFQQAVARLDSVGAISEVVQSQYGYHLIKLTDRDTLPSYEAAYDNLKEKIADRPRVDRQKTQFAHRVRTDAGVRVDTSAILNALPTPTLDTLSRPLLSVLDTDSASADVPVAILGDSTYTLHQLAQHVTQVDGGAQSTVREILEDFLNAKAFTYAQATLATRDSVFAAKMKEYREGLLSFQFMEDSVWTVAAQDTAALRRFFQQHRDRYRFPKRIRTLVLRAPTDSLLQPYQPATKRGRPISSVVWDAQRDSLVRLDTLQVTDDSPAVYRRIQSVNDGEAVGPITHDGSALLLLRDATLPARRKTFDEAVNAVTQDYQDEYEDRVLSRLRRRYDVQTYPDRLRNAFANGSSQ